jgi:hypothetical protein
VGVAVSISRPEKSSWEGEDREVISTVVFSVWCQVGPQGRAIHSPERAQVNKPLRPMTLHFSRRKTTKTPKGNLGILYFGLRKGNQMPSDQKQTPRSKFPEFSLLPSYYLLPLLNLPSHLSGKDTNAPRGFIKSLESHLW